AEQPAVEIEKLVDDVNEIVDASIADTIFDGLKTRILAAETEDVPRIDEGAASDTALEQVLDGGEILGSVGEAAIVDAEMAGREQNLHLGQDAHGGDRDTRHLAASGAGVADLREQQSELALLQL